MSFIVELNLSKEWMLVDATFECIILFREFSNHFRVRSLILNPFYNNCIVSISEIPNSSNNNDSLKNLPTS